MPSRSTPEGGTVRSAAGARRGERQSLSFGGLRAEGGTPLWPPHPKSCVEVSLLFHYPHPFNKRMTFPVMTPHRGVKAFPGSEGGTGRAQESFWGEHGRERSVPPSSPAQAARFRQTLSLGLRLGSASVTAPLLSCPTEGFFWKEIAKCESGEAGRALAAVFCSPGFEDAWQRHSCVCPLPSGLSASSPTRGPNSCLFSSPPPGPHHVPEQSPPPQPGVWWSRPSSPWLS